MLKNIFVFTALFFVLTSTSYAAELETREWSHLPMNHNFTGLAFAYTQADIFLDPVLLIEDAEMDLQTWVGRYIRSFEFLNKSARVDITQLYQKGDWNGLLNGTPASVKREGFSDTFMRVAINLVGAPPLKGKEFLEYRSKLETETILGVGFAMRFPTGEYMENKLINLGENRMIYRPQIGGVHNWGKWTFEATTHVAFFEDNEEFFAGNTLEQEPLSITYGHLIYNFRPGLWAGISAGYDYGGERTINGVEKDDRKKDIAWAASFAYPVGRQFGVKVAYIGSRTQVDTGLDTNTFSIAFTANW